jgi:hypothetical protein
MSPQDASIPALDEVCQLNRVFLAYLRANPETGREHFGLSPRAAKVLAEASLEEIDRAADFPRALFELSLPPSTAGQVMDPLGLARESGRRVLKLTLLQSAWHLSRVSGYAARLLMRLKDGDIRRLRTSAIDDILMMSLADNVVHTAFNQLDWIWNELLTETRPEHRRRLLLIGFQPDLALPSTAPGSDRQEIRA